MLNYIKKNGNLIHKTAVINWKKTHLGKNNIIGPYVVIGNIAQHPKSKSVGIVKLVITMFLMNIVIFTCLQISKKSLLLVIIIF